MNWKELTSKEYRLVVLQHLNKDYLETTKEYKQEKNVEQIAYLERRLRTIISRISELKC